MASAVQQGTALKIGFASFSYTGYIPDDGLTWKKPLGNVEEHTDGDGAMLTKILMDQRDEFSVEFIILDATGDITPPSEGTAVTFTDPDNTSVTAFVTEAPTTFNRGAAKLSLDLVKEASMTYVADPWTP
jgi:hypothetical protein